MLPAQPARFWRYPGIPALIQPGPPLCALCAVSFLACLVFLLSGCSREANQLPSPTPPARPTPTDTLASLPDLVISAVTLDDNSSASDPCAPTSVYRMRVTINNQGEASAGLFVVQANNERKNVLEGLPAGKQIELVFVTRVTRPDIWVDVTSLVAESNEGNNFWAGQLPTPTISPRCIQTPTPAVAFQQPLDTLEGHQAAVLCVAFSPDGNYLASGSVDNTLRLWQVNPRRLLRTMLGHPFPVLTLEFTPNGTMLATGSTDGLVRLWQVVNGSLLRTLEGHAGWVTDLDISPDGTMLVSSSQDFTVRIWRLPDGEQLETIDEGMTSLAAVSFSPDRLKIAWAEASGMVRVRALGGKWLYTWKETNQAATSIAFSPGGKLLIAGFADGTMRAWQMSDGKLLQTLKGHSKTVAGLAFSPDGRWLVSASHDSTLRLWKLDESGLQPVPLVIFTGHSGPVNSVDFSPRGGLIASASDDGTVRLWEIPAELLP